MIFPPEPGKIRFATMESRSDVSLDVASEVSFNESPGKGHQPSPAIGGKGPRSRNGGKPKTASPGRYRSGSPRDRQGSRRQSRHRRQRRNAEGAVCRKLTPDQGSGSEGVGESPKRENAPVPNAETAGPAAPEHAPDSPAPGPVATPASKTNVRCNDLRSSR